VTGEAIAAPAPRIGIRAACRAAGLAQASWYRRHRSSPAPARREPVPHRDRAQPRALAPAEHWLSVIAEGPTDFLELPVRGETRWANEAYTNEIWSNYYDNLQRPQRVTRWQWEHVLAHIRAGDQPPLARVLLTTAKRAAATGNSRLAVIDAATAAEVGLTAGLADRLSAVLPRR